MQGTLHIQDSSGDTTIAWDTETKGPLDPVYAEKEFQRMVSQGHLAYGTTEEGVNEHIREFNPERYPKVTLTPPLVGG